MVHRIHFAMGLCQETSDWSSSSSAILRADDDIEAISAAAVGGEAL